MPLDGISINDVMYIYHSTDGMTRSVLVRSMNDGGSFTLVEDNVSVDYFINVSVNKITRKDYPGLPGNFENGFSAFGTGGFIQITSQKGRINQVDLYSIGGEFLQSLSLARISDQAFELDLTNFPPGVYMIRMRGKEIQETLKIVRID